MSKNRADLAPVRNAAAPPGYDAVLAGMVELLESARRAAAKSINDVMTTTYWEVGRRIVERDQQGAERAQYGDAILKLLAVDLTQRLGRGFSERNLASMRRFYLAWPIPQTASAKLARTPTKGRKPANELAAPRRNQAQAFNALAPMRRFPLPWSHYVELLKVKSVEARDFYETEALRGGWTVQQLQRQITTLFYERTMASRKKAAMLRKGARKSGEDFISAEEELKDPLVLEFLDLKDEYSESDLEESLILRLEQFLLELGGEFTFVGRQRRLRVGDEWYRIDLIFFRRRLRCLVLIDLKLGKFTHADAGQMHLYLNYAQEHWTSDHENPPVGMILCTQKDNSVAHYSLKNLPNKILAAEYLTALPEKETLAAEIVRTRKKLEARRKRTRLQ